MSDNHHKKLRGPAQQPPRPNDNTYWLIPGKLLAGEYPGYTSDSASRVKLRRFLELGVTCFIDLTHPYELNHYDHVLRSEAQKMGLSAQYERLSIIDQSIPRPAKMKKILDTIDAAIADGHGVYVHCWGGIGRTGTVVGCYLVRYGNNSTEALAEIARLWENMEKNWRVSRSPETDEQHDFVKNWDGKEQPNG